MSIHSRSSSEVETTPYGEILKVFFKDFYKDFDFSDVRDKVRDLFKDSEYDYIAKETGVAQILHLLWILENKSDEFILQFLDKISYEYKWIVDKIKLQLHDHSIETTEYLEKLKRIQLDNQKHTDYNVHRTKPFIQLREALCNLSSTRAGCAVLLGELGSGKKWLAIDVCSDFTVMKRMNFKIFWIDCINCVSAQEDYNALKTLMIKLNPSFQFDDYNNINNNNIKIEKEILKIKINQLLKTKEFFKCLLVLANVQNSKCQEAFNLDCKRLVITRNKKVSESLSKKWNTHLTLDVGLNSTEFHLLLDKNVKKYNWRKDTGNFADDIYHMSNGDPYMLSIIAKNLEKRSNWVEWKKHLDNLEIPDQKFIRDIENSLKILTPELLKLYATFAVFPYCARIPVKLIATLWNMELRQAENIVKKLHDDSFVKKEILDDNDTVVCSLKYVYSSYIKNSAKIQKLVNAVELHRKIIEYYQVEENLNVRKDVDLFYGAEHDCYFFRCIGYHLYGAKYKRLFAKLYMDFGFLGQKMRTVGLANTIADLHDYESEIFQSNNLLKKFKAFLAKSEEKILHAHDCCLLQYALLADEPISGLAHTQIGNFSHRVWFSESGQFHQRRFIISLTKYAKLIRILESDICVVVLFNNDTFLVDISLNSVCGPVQLIDATSANITEIKMFNNNNHLLTLDDYGNLKLWKIEDEKRRMMAQRRDDKTNYNPTNLKLCPSQIKSRPFKQIINDRISSTKKIVAINLKNHNSTTDCVLHVALENGNIIILDWNSILEEFEQKYYYPVKTDISNINSICKINTHLMIMDYNNNSSSMQVTFLQLRNTAKEYLENLQWPKNQKLIYYEVFNDSFILFVFSHTIVSLSLKFYPYLSGELKVLYENEHCMINCAKLCLNNHYLLLGTERGLLVFDMRNRLDILQSIVSENIRCLDNYDLDDEEYKTMIVCGIENKNILYLFGLRKVNGNGLVWEHSCLHSAMEKVTLEEQKNTRFLGEKLFDITSDDETLYAVDSKNRIHQICCSETKNWSIIPSPHSARKIIAISAYKSSIVIAFENGEIYDLRQKRCLVKSTTNSRINMEYLKLINDKTLITSSSSSSNENTFITHIDSVINNYEVPTLTKYCAMVTENHLLIVNNYGAILFFDCANNFKHNVDKHAKKLLADCDLKDNMLFLAFTHYLVDIYSLVKTDSGIECHKRCELSQLGKGCTITCLTATADAKLFAIGLNTEQSSPNNLRSCGDIEVFKLDENYKEHLLYCLKSHTNPIYDMMFSPHSDILVSISEKICFWNINYILNNPLNVGNTKRHSSRFTSQASTEEVDANMDCQPRKNKFLQIEQFSTDKLPLKIMDNATASLEISHCLDDLNDNVFAVIEDEENIWPNFRGPGDKPELLACLKLDGNVAKQIFANKDFTQFFTIDDEGVYYNLKLIKPPKQISPDSVDFGDYSSSSESGGHEHLYIKRLSIASSSTMSGADVVDDAST